jgi:hypothetical protein
MGKITLSYLTSSSGEKYAGFTDRCLFSKSGKGHKIGKKLKRKKPAISEFKSALSF